ncbi:MAG TPA: SPFH domain-containing protein [Ktedonobacterales bacterium]|nr:SPFH domain-containing protein [Ktedonobacterales bacterium]
MLTGKSAAHTAGGFSAPAFVYIVFGMALLVIWLVATRRPVNEPYRAVIYRLARMHRISGPGYVFVLPFIDRIESELAMGERECAVKPQGGTTADGTRLAPRLEVTWRLHLTLRGRPSHAVSATLALPDERIVRLVDESVTSAARAVLGRYTRSDLTHEGARESAMWMVQYTANDALAPRGLQIERVFWRA